MARDFNDVRIEYEVKNGAELPVFHFKVYTDIREFKKISGHRFVSLVDHKNPFQNDLSTLLQFIGRSPYFENDYTKCGNALEYPVVKASERKFGLEEIEHGFSFEDLENGTDDFHFIRDLMYVEDGKSHIGEVKTFYNKKKIGLSKTNPVPEPHISWWLQTRLEAEILDKPARIFYYYVEPVIKNAILKNRPVTIKEKHLFMSDVIEPTDGEEEVVTSYFTEFGFTKFKELMDYANERRDEMFNNYYEDEGGTFYYVVVEIKQPWYRGEPFIMNYINDIKKDIKIERIG